jgi:coenzyme F420-0:L-glutamate ligase / coenzyme F420-1:gamma-L-glutamate ligase
MQTLNDVLKTRRSIRKYQPKSIPLNIIRELLESAGKAPSAHNSQPWRFVVLLNEKSKRDLAEAMAKTWRKHMKKVGTPEKRQEELINHSIERFTQAPAIIMAFITMKDLHAHKDPQGQLNERDMAVQSLSAGIENLLLTANSKQLGACWYCTPLFCKDTVRNVLKIPAEIEPQALITIGYPAEIQSEPRKKTVEEYVFLESWNQKMN